MNRAYVDTSCFLAVLRSEPGAGVIARRLATLDFVCVSTVLEAELLAEGVAAPEDVLAALHWIAPARRLTSEMRRVLTAGQLRSAAAWHLACALYFFSEPAGRFFLTLDGAQRTAAENLGFATEWSAL